MAKHRIDKFLWINLIVDDDKSEECDVEVKFDHDTDKKLIVSILEQALQQIKNNPEVEHTHEEREEEN